MNALFFLASLLVASPLGAAAYTASSGGRSAAPSAALGNRRAFLSNLAGGAAAMATLGANPGRSLAAEAQEEHEFVLAERSLLGRKDNELTSLTGYAGGTKAGSEGRVCYHNFQSVADYGKLGHGEVVGMTIPQSSIGDFAVEYFKLFGDKGERADPMDKGGEYRSLLGLPGGKNHPMYGQVEAAAKARGMTLADGKGNDPDTLGKRLVYVYDTKAFPFYQAEVYHQYHNDFLSPAYGKQYNELVDAALDDGRVKITGCPDRVHRIKTTVKKNEPLILGSIGVATVGLILCLLYMLWSRPKFLYMPLYDGYDKDSDAEEDDDTAVEAEMARTPVGFNERMYCSVV